MSKRRHAQYVKVKWGQIEVNGLVFKDAVITPSSERNWDWKATGTSHSKGTQFDDFKCEFFAKRPTHIILSTGFEERLNVGLDVKDERFEGIAIYQLKSDLAAEKYNELVKEKENYPILVLHSTC